ncbi:threonine-phosphate decarboxylase CobD [Dasania sp. GY-MA-18]|uniref:threonine-phosphate decarboxylase n=1 Tax=Dasania phycosphaerae TaxID=2950436 RepID=A0A9J6RL46_9GAMM|nr:MULTISPECIES: threonine-phosphate decarboxylase CobD [Dasania]MCR8922500.1 threonine-phosphate decarboxylase CobD [Dasania sp. GY-MA-18]MCZ0864928.1 threonine-phosphate decarboxylase CobD [Dasania phycosphaerae]MCZ0868656.1 threonine-phosphate decarboxylase CobD [Dasania phycosphaerae]
MLEHGGNLLLAQQQYPEAQQPWIDLSTGISPWSWPVPTIPETCWQRLPEISESFNIAVADYYGVQGLVPVAGSQQAIELLPQLLPAARVAMPIWGYSEHSQAWQKAGHQVLSYNSYQQLQNLLEQVEHVLVINPNNPTGELWSCEALQKIQQQVSGYLVVDEAFIDSCPQPSMLQHVSKGSLIVLRSMGKFFGLAGIRLGFIYLPHELKTNFEQRLLLWGVTAPSLYIAELALSDKTWQQQQRERIKQMQQSMLVLLATYLPGLQLKPGPLFISVSGPHEILAAIKQQFAQQGIWLRIFSPIEPQGEGLLRFGIPADTERCLQALKSINL